MSLSALGQDCAPLRSVNPPAAGPAEWRSAGSVQVGDHHGAEPRVHGGVDRILYGAGGGRLHLRFGDAPPHFERAVVDGGAAGRLVVERPVRNLAIALRAESVDFSVLLEEAGRAPARAPASGTVHVRAAGGRQRPLRVLITAAECAPLAISGQLAGVVGETAAAATGLGYDVVLAIPLHRGAQLGVDAAVRVAELHCASAGRVVVGRVIQGALPGLGVPVLSVDIPAYFDRDGMYGDPDDGDRYLAFSAMVEAILRATAFAPDIVHGFEWQTAAVLAAVSAADNPPATVFSAAADAPGYRVPTAALSGRMLDEGYGDDVELLELGRQSATVVAPRTSPDRLAALYESALDLSRLRD